MADEAWDVIGVFNHEDHVDVCRLCEEVADGDGVEELCRCKAALDNGKAEGIAEQEESLLDTKGAEEDATVGVILHGLGHGERIGGGVAKLCGGLVAGRR